MEMVCLTSEFAKTCHASTVGSGYASEKYQFSESEDCMTIHALRDNWADLPAFKSQLSGHFRSIYGRSISMLIGAWSDGFQPPRQARCTR